MPSLSINDMVSIKGCDRKLRVSGLCFHPDIEDNKIMETGTPYVRLHIEAYRVNWYALVPESEVEK